MQALDVADQIAACYGRGRAVLFVTGAWTGARWGALTGLRWPNPQLHDDDTGDLVIDPENGSLHEDDSGRLWLGPPKTEESARTISLPPFRVRLLRSHVATHNHEHVFVTVSARAHSSCGDPHLSLVTAEISTSRFTSAISRRRSTNLAASAASSIGANRPSTSSGDEIGSRFASQCPRNGKHQARF